LSGGGGGTDRSYSLTKVRGFSFKNWDFTQFIFLQQNRAFVKLWITFLEVGDVDNFFARYAIHNIMQLGTIIDLNYQMPKIKQNLFRETNQRQLILDYLHRSLAHPTAQEIFQIIKKDLPRVSLSTIYRNLIILEKQGKVSSLSYSKNFTRFELNHGDHYHFVCQKCDKVEHIDLDPLLELNSQLAKRHDLNVERHQLIFFGLCKNCQKKK